MAEWIIAAVLKTVDPKGSVGSNPTLSATDSWQSGLMHRFAKPAVLMYKARRFKSFTVRHMAPSSNRLGRHPFKVVTRVRTPLALPKSNVLNSKKLVDKPKTHVIYLTCVTGYFDSWIRFLVKQKARFEGQWIDRARCAFLGPPNKRITLTPCIRQELLKFRGTGVK